MERDPEDLWDGEFGEEYTERNDLSVQEANEISEQRFGVSRTERMERFLGSVDRDARILEVGTNIGTQLKCLESIGFENLYGIDIQKNAVQKAHRTRPELNIIEGSADDIPFKDDFFDLVFTSVVLIHIPPERIETVLDEVVRCTSEWVYGYEYFAEEYTEVQYRGHDELLWKTDFPSLYLERFDLELVEKEFFEYQTDEYDNDTVDVEFLLRTPEA
ncbi:methyltransferase type 11 [Salinigranum rubrum]|uniref:Methyltransferase type 11 n=1 Tax=Salinigranum rubrum TaxID=755307 RepID=A0A2I8VIP2_9EURY|nr:pseudaminic acid biosynthesis-associated methylase [Salinigranum rubrum]AUV81813.1 methyltransferase type 11 [Salinigranum rubrum]